MRVYNESAHLRLCIHVCDFHVCLCVCIYMYAHMYDSFVCMHKCVPVGLACLCISVSLCVCICVIYVSVWLNVCMYVT